MGIRFGLASGIVNTQSVLNCMPKEAFWNYKDQPAPDSQEALLLDVLRNFWE
jgi:coproporphyrinogen III oxidase|nr:coproporphyrinogen III oxidase [Brasilonema octagenarum]